MEILFTIVRNTHKELAKHVDRSAPLHTMGEVFDRFIVEWLPLLAARTQSDYLGYIENLRLLAGDRRQVHRTR